MQCLTPNDASENFCQNCHAAIGDINSLDPVQSIRDEGFLLRKAASGQPRLIVVVGTWILFLPAVIAAIALEISVISNWDGWLSYIIFLVTLAVLIMAVLMLYHVTKNYRKARDEVQVRQQQKDLQSENRLRAKARRQARMKDKKSSELRL